MSQDLEKRLLAVEARTHAHDILLTMLLRAAHAAPWIDLRTCSEMLDAQHTLAAAQIAIAGDDAERAAQGLEHALSLVIFAAQNP